MITWPLCKPYVSDSPAPLLEWSDPKKGALKGYRTEKSEHESTYTEMNFYLLPWGAERDGQRQVTPGKESGI